MVTDPARRIMIFALLVFAGIHRSGILREAKTYREQLPGLRIRADVADWVISLRHGKPDNKTMCHSKGERNRDYPS